jgi:hypothetical protein
MRAITPLVLVVLLTSCVAAQPATRLATQPIEVAVRTGRPLPTTQESPPMQGSVPMYYTYGTNVEITARRPGQEVLGIDDHESRLDTVVDDRGTVIFERKGDGLKERWPVANITREHQSDSTGADFWFPSAPSTDARRITVRGKVVLLVGTDVKTSDPVPLDRAGRTGELNLGDELKLTWSNSDAGKEGPFAVRIGRAGSIERIREVQFFDGTGRRMRSERGGGNSLLKVDEGRLVSQQQDWRLAEPVPERFSMRIVYCAGVRREELPIDVTLELPPLRTGPSEERIKLDRSVAELSIKYDLYKLRDMGLTPADVRRHIDARLAEDKPVTTRELRELLIPIKGHPGIAGVDLEYLVEEIDVTLRPTTRAATPAR